MAIENYVATATPIAGGEPVQGFVLYDKTNGKAYIVPSEGTTFTFQDGVDLKCASASVKEVDPASVKLESLNLEDKTIPELTANGGAISVSPGYDGIRSVTITAVKLEDPEAFTPEQATVAGESTITKTDASAWGLGTVKVKKVVTETKTFTPTKEGGSVTPTAGKLLSAVTVNAVPLQDGGTITPSDTEQSAPVLSGGNIGYSGFKVSAVPVDSAFKKTITPTKDEQTLSIAGGKYISGSITVNGYIPNLQEKTVNPSEAPQDISADPTYDGLSKVTVQAIQIDSAKNTATPAVDAQKITPDSGKYFKEFNVKATPLAEAVNLTPSGEIQTPDLAGNIGFKGITVQAVPLDNKEITATKEKQTVTPTSGKYMTQVVVNGYTPNLQTKNTAPTESEQTINADPEYDGLSAVTVDAIQIDSAKNTATPSLESQTINPTDGKYFKTFTVNPAPLAEAKTVTPTGEQQVVDLEGSIGIKGVTVEAVPLDNKEITATKDEQTVTPAPGKFMTQVVVNGYVPNLQEKTIAPSESEEQVTADPEYDGLRQVTVSGIQTETKTVTPSKESQEVTPAGGKYLKSVTVNPYEAKVTPVTVDELAKGEKITTPEGFDGISEVTVSAVKLEGASVIPTRDVQTVVAKEVDTWGLNAVEVEGYTVKTQEKTVQAFADHNTEVLPDDGYDGLGKVTVAQIQVENPSDITPSLDEQTIQSEEGKFFNSVKVLATPLDEAITVQSTTEDVIKTPTGLGYKGVTVTGDKNLVSGNIKKGTSILGVAGSYKGPESGTDENGFAVGDWVSLDLPESLTRSESFRYAPYYKNHYLGRCFDGGDYLAISVFNKNGQSVATVLLNDILGKLYINKEDFEESPFENKEELVLDEGKTYTLAELSLQKVTSITGKNSTINLEDGSPLTLEGDVFIEGVTFTGASVDHSVADPSINGIKLTEGSSLTLKNCVLENFGIAIYSVGTATSSVTLSNVTINNCYKGVYSENMGDLGAFDCHFSHVGEGSESAGGSEEEKFKRSGSVFDLNQICQGGSILVSGCTFENIGQGENSSEESTSGGIKIKTRGQEYKAGADGSFSAIYIADNAFTECRKDLVLGTSNKPETFPSSLAIKAILVGEIAVQDNSGNGYIKKGNALVKEN